jgi:hypothetical protein
VWKEKWRDVGVIAEEVAFGNAEFRPKRFLEVGEADGAAFDFEVEVDGLARNERVDASLR